VKLAFANGANFTLQKPVTMMQIERALRASRGLTFKGTAEVM
jgi:hypothetical protein